MQKVLSAEEMREVERRTTEKYGIPSLLLMENAAQACARIITEKLGGRVSGKSFLILCGKGSNGGDGAALARILGVQGAFVDIVLFGKIEDTKGDARANLEMCSKLNGSIGIELLECNSREEWDAFVHSQIQDWDAMVDAIFGTGLSRPLEGWLGNVVHDINFLNDTQKSWFSYNRLLVSIDVPSGLNSDSGELIGENFRAELTITFTAPKPANVLAPASRFNGELVTANIGSPSELIDDSPSELFLTEKDDVKLWIDDTRFTGDSHKTARGRAIIIAGSRNMSGAAALCANAAMRSGVGLVRVATAESAQNAVSSHAYPEVMVAGLPETASGAISEEALEKVEKLSEKMHAVSIGSGLSSDEETTRKFVRAIVENRKTPIVIDADGLNALAPFDLQGSEEFPMILTPHVGEMRKLLGDEAEDFADRVKVAREFAGKHKVILVLKGERSLIAAPDGRVVVNPTGNSGLGKAGNGDTLAGIITGFAAQAAAMKVDIFESIVAAVYIAGLAGDIAERKFGKRVMTASDVRDCMSEAFEELARE